MDPPPFIQVDPAGANIELNFLDVEAAPSQIHVDVRSGIGKVTIVVPPEWDVNTNRLTSSMMGCFRSKVRDTAVPGYPQIHLTGVVGMGTLIARHADLMDRWRAK